MNSRWAGLCLVGLAGRAGSPILLSRIDYTGPVAVKV